MSGYEEQLHARAEMLEETGELAAAVTAITVGASGAGVDPRAIVSLRAAIRALDPAGAPPGYQACSRTDRHSGGGYGSDAEFLEAACQALAAAHAMPVKKECDGCHSRKAAAIAAAEAALADAEERVRDATRRISICEDTAEILDPLTRRLEAALQALRQVPHDLGEVYELIYAFIRRGGKMPRFGRWIEGATPGMNRTRAGASSHAAIAARPGQPAIPVPGEEHAVNARRTARQPSRHTAAEPDTSRAAGDGMADRRTVPGLRHRPDHDR